ncbi:MAG: Ig-like domain-containing protein, partial [Treponema sp.]|nr:Ig-like domain-containing protein [Treponema sp.]
MKKQNLILIFTGLFFAVSLLFSGCFNMFGPSVQHKAPAGSGIVYVSFSAGRTALSPEDLGFSSFKFTFTQNDAVVLCKELENAGAFAFTLPLGAGYTLSVEAYREDSGDEVLAATGTSAVFELTSSGATVAVGLKGVITGDVEGTFSYAITYPVDTDLEEFALINSDDLYINLYAGAKDSGTCDKGDVSGFIDLLPGNYFLVVRLSRTDGKAAGYSNGVVVYSNNTTAWEKNFDTTSFKTPMKGQPVRVTDWHGFNVAGPEGYVSGAIGTCYGTYTDAWGTYTDVLRLAPPIDGYDESSMALSFTTAEEGYYKISMSVMVEKWPEHGVDILWQDIDTWDALTGNDGKIQGVEAGEWFTVSTGDPDGVFLPGDSVFALLTKQNNNPGNSIYNGLNDAVIYIKDLRLELNGSIPVVDTTESDGHVYGVVITPPAFGINAGDERTLTVQVFPSGAENKNVSWSSDDENIATVDQNGLVTAVAAGDTVITVVTEDGGKTAKSFVTVYDAGWVEPKYIALTFDDGPDASATPRLLGVLAQWNVHATFFLVGNNAKNNPDVVRAIKAGGHDIGNHSLTHDGTYYDISNGAYHEQSEALYKQEVIDTQDIIRDITGIVPVFYRSPHLCQAGNLLRAVESTGLPNMFAKLFSDWVAGTTPEQICQNTIGQEWPWGIFDFHDCGENPENTVDAIPLVLDNLINKQGYTVVSLSEMMALRKALYLNPGTIYNDFVSTGPDMNYPSDGNIIKLDSLSIPDQTISLNSGETRQLSVVLTPSNATRGKVFWYSENDNIATVSSDGLVTAHYRGTTTIRANADGRMAVATVTVSGAQAVDSWTVFKYDGSDYSSSNAVGTIGSWEGYSNVLRLALPAGTSPSEGTVAMSYPLPIGGNCTLSMDVWVQKRNYDDIQIYWEESETNDWHCVAQNSDPISEGTWLHVETPGPGSWNLPAQDILYLLVLNKFNTGMKDAVVYFRDLKLVIDGQDILNIPSGPYDPSGAFDEVSESGWTVFDYEGKGYAPGPSYAQGTVVTWDNYSNVLRLAMPEGSPVSAMAQKVAMTYVLPASGDYSLSMDMWVEKRNYQDIQILWQEASGAWRYLAMNSGPVTEGAWLHISTPDSGYLNMAGNTLIYLLVANVVNGPDNKPVLDEYGNMILADGIKDAVVYMRDLKLTCNGASILDIPSVKTAPETPVVNPGITFQWADSGIQLAAQVNGGSLITQNPLTVSQGSAVTLSVTGNFSAYEWEINRVVISTGSTYT